MSAILDRLEAEKDAKLHQLVGALDAALEDRFDYGFESYKESLQQQNEAYIAAREAYSHRLQQECGWTEELSPQQDGNDE